MALRLSVSGVPDGVCIVSLKATWYRDRLTKKAKKGFQGYPVASIIFYGPTNTRATKVAVGITRAEGSAADLLERWISEPEDVRFNPAIAEAIVHFLQRNGVKSVVMTEAILGCPHEEGIDYPVGAQCPRCDYWRDRDRFTGQRLAGPHEASEKTPPK